MTHYLLAVHSSDADYDTPIEEAQPRFDAVAAFNERLMAEGTWVFGGGLKRIESATTVDGRGDDVIVTDGPFAETKEYLGGFWVIEAPDVETARRIAGEASHACQAKVEVRPFEGE
jgi:hypothetical protein